jgi:Lipid A 3-O-deacylase (PagL)
MIPFMPRRRGSVWGAVNIKGRSRDSTATAVAVALLGSVGLLSPSMAAADDAGAGAADQGNHFDLFTPCARCRLLLGAGETFQLWGWSNGLVLPMTLELSDSRWEIGTFRFVNRQIAVGYPPIDNTWAEPFWGFSGMRRWQFLHRSWGRMYFGFGGSYKTETDKLDGTRWNFAYLLGVRFDLGSSGSLLEIAARHWSNAYIKSPNRGENFATLSFSF